MLTYDASLDVVKSYVYVTLTVAYLLMLLMLFSKNNNESILSKE